MKDNTDPPWFEAMTPPTAHLSKKGGSRIYHEKKNKKNLSVVRRKDLEERNEMIYIQSIIYRI